MHQPSPWRPLPTHEKGQLSLSNELSPPPPPPTDQHQSGIHLLRTASSSIRAQFAEPPPLPPTKLQAPPQLNYRPPPPPPPPLPFGAGECVAMRERHGVVIGSSWGSLTPVGQQRWTQLGCDAALRGQPPTRRSDAGGPRVGVGVVGGGIDGGSNASPAVSAFERDYRQRHAAAIASRSPERRLSRGDGGARSVVVAVCACTTSRGLHPAGLGALTLFKLMLPSLVDTVRADARAFREQHGAPLELWVYVAYDSGDAFYDTPQREAEVRAWLDAHVVAPLASAGVRVRHALLRFDNALRKPGPAFNFMMAAAAEDGADYLYRVNDDTQFATPWVVQSVRTLRTYSPPNVGVVGPVCREGNTAILTHDLVHRKHLEIFGIYYPPILSDWWMDDWITHVYGAARTTKGPHLVKHHVWAQGTRYAVDYSHERALSGELVAGRLRLQRWLSSSPPHAKEG